jgi:hypothetical protein
MNLNKTRQIIEIFKRYKWQIIAFTIVFTVIFLIMLVTNQARKNTPVSPRQQQQNTNGGIATIPSPEGQKPFHILKTSPTTNEQNVYSGEIAISFTTDVPILSPDVFSLSITPPLQHYWKFENTYPTNQVTARVYGELKTGTTYTLQVKDAKQTPVYTWSFTTSSTPAEDTSGLQRDYETKLIQQYYPLFNYIPYSNEDFSIDYLDRLTLTVVLKHGDTPQMRQEVLDWIKNHGVDPATHTINYTN